MCGRYDLIATVEELAARFGVPTRDLSVPLTTRRANGASFEWQPSYNIAPQQYNPVVVRDHSGNDGHRQLELMRWGLVPAWSKEAKVKFSTINARAETVATKPTFRKPLATQRCLVPATGYFEWVEGAQDAQNGPRSNRGSQVKQPYRIQVRGEGVDEIFAIAGLYDTWRGPNGEELQTYTIVTTTANDALSAIHSRMPVILPRELEEVWLDGNNEDIESLLSLLRPFPQESMTAYPVPQLVNSPRNEGRHLIEPLLIPVAPVVRAA